MNNVARLATSFLLTATLVLLGGCGGGQSQQQGQESSEPSLPEGELAIENMWVRPTASGETAELYMSLANGQSTADTLLSVEAPIIGSVEIQQVADSAGTTTTSSLGTLPIPPNTRVTLEPGGKRVVLKNVSQPLRDGETIVLNVDFAQAGLRRVRASITSTPPTASQ